MSQTLYVSNYKGELIVQLHKQKHLVTHFTFHESLYKFPEFSWKANSW